MVVVTLGNCLPMIISSEGSDTSGYDEYVEGVEADETASLETPLTEVAITSLHRATRGQCMMLACGQTYSPYLL